MNFKEGDIISGGDIFGYVYENDLIPKHYIMCPPQFYGEVVEVYGRGTDGHESYTVNDTVLKIKKPQTGETQKLTLKQNW